MKALIRRGMCEDRDVASVLALATELLTETAADTLAPKRWEEAAALELAVASWHAMAGDFTLRDATTYAANGGALARSRAAVSLARERADARAAWLEAVKSTTMRVRAIRALGEHTAARRADKSNVLTMVPGAKKKATG